ncbi:MAG: endonuclease/exonuclease/phosphatase family protein [Mucilaginibacter polytrichastri]|nr:endonuclease/exonuclease/phosphatase family protein [Mucilaginibacter polytrichastri]
MSWIQRIMFFFTCLAGGVLLISYTAAYIDPADFWYPAFFGLAYPFILAVNILFLAYWLLMRRWLALFPLLFILCGYNVLIRNVALRFPQRELPPGARRDDADVVRVLSYNVHQFTPFEAPKQDVDRRNQFVALLKSEMPDIACLQEFYARNKGRFANVDTVKKALSMAHFKLRPTFESKTEMAGMAIFSRYPIRRTGTLNFEEHGENALWADIELKKGRIIRIYSIHLQSLHMEQEDYRFIEEVKNSDANPVNIKPGSPSRRIGGRLKTAFIKRSVQAQIVRDAVKHSPYPYIICGDFNDTPASYALHTIAAGTKNAFTERGSGFVRTYNGAFPNFQIDYILASEKAFDVLTYSVNEQKLSDHYAVRSDLRLK